MAFAGALGNFSFQTIGEQTEDEKMIGEGDIDQPVALHLVQKNHNSLVF